MEAGICLSLIVNGAAHEVASDSTVASLLASLAVEPRLVVVELNRAILRDRDAYAALALRDGDVVEIVHFVGGG